MKTFRNIAAALFFFAAPVALSATAHAKGCNLTAQTAADASHRLQLIEKSLTDEGFTLDGVQEQPIYYFAAPQAPYAWGHLVYTFVRPVRHSHQVQRVEVSAEVQSLADGFSFPQITIRELPAQ
ncbi:MAG TPA: hypothetical protein PLW65_03955 [Pseudomonadota bacterium]|nr:hypothetical protein [Pseudomonadota bacterium]